MPESSYTQNHYEVLSLPSDPSASKALTDQDIRLAYRRALLLHHPDKSRPSLTSPPSSQRTIDAITLAYKTLIDPDTRSDHDRSLLTSPPATTAPRHPPHPGLETVDLGDMGWDGKEQMWYRGCRCGKDGAYVITEEELELNAEYGETITPCQGCSLWLRVTFAVAEDGAPTQFLSVAHANVTEPRGWVAPALLLSLRDKYRDTTWPVSKRLEAIYSSGGFIMSTRAGVSLMVAGGGLLRRDLQPRAKVREGFLMQLGRKGMLCRKIAATV